MIGVFFIATSWGKQNGGINSINYSLTKNFAEIVKKYGWKVYCVLTEDKADSDMSSYVEEHDHIELITTKNPVSSTRIKKIIKINKFEQVFFVGHDVITGQYANELRDIHKDSVSIIFHHMYYQSYYYSRENDPEKIRQKEEMQKDIIPNADIIVAVGPKLLKSANDLCIDARKEPRICEIVPGLENIAPITKIHNNHTIILFGRLEERNDGVKQIGLAIDALAEYIGEQNKDYTIKCYGYSDDSEKNQKQLLEQAFRKARKSVNIRANSYITDEKKLYEEIASASLCIMPSFFEGFGLTAYEAISAGVPVIISQNTGLYEFLINKQGERIDHLFQSLNIKGNPTSVKAAYTQDDKESLKKCIDYTFKDYKRRKQEALDLREKLMDAHYTWEYAAREFVEIIKGEVRNIPTVIPIAENTTKKTNISLSDYISDFMISEYCSTFCDTEKIILKIVKYIGDRRITLFSSDKKVAGIKHMNRSRAVNDGTVGILNLVYSRGDYEFPIVISDFTDSRCFGITEKGVIDLNDLNLGVPDHHVLSIIALPIIHDGNIMGAITLDIYDEEFVKKTVDNRSFMLKTVYSCLRLFAEHLTSRLYYQVKDDINFSEVNRMLTEREIISFKGRCPLECKHCFATDIVDDNEKEDEIADVIASLEEKTFDVIYVSHYKENFYKSDKGVSLCEELYAKYQCDICVTTRCILAGEFLVRIKKLNDLMNTKGNRLTFCISIPAYDSYNKFEKEGIVPTPHQRIDFASQLKNLNITSIVTIRPMFPSTVISQEEIHRIVDNCVGKVDAILTGGLCVSDKILERLNLSDSDLSYLDDVESEYLVGTEKKFNAVDVNSEMNDLENYCMKKDIPFFKHSMEALNYFKNIP